MDPLFEIPPPLRAEPAELHEKLSAATREPGAVGEADVRDHAPGPAVPGGPVPCSRPLEQAVIPSVAAIVAACRGLADARPKGAA